MGLALHNPSLWLSDLTELRHLPPGSGSTKTRHHISKGRYYNWLQRYGWHAEYLGHGGDCNDNYPSHLPPRLR